MGRPYIQFELDALNVIPMFAKSTGMTVENIIAGLVMLWAHCYRAKVNVVRIPELRGFFGACEGLVPAMVAHGFAEDLGDRVRVKGVDRYTRLSEVRAEAGRKGGQSTQQKATPKRSPGGRFAGVSTEATRKQLLPSDDGSGGSTSTEAIASVTEAKQASKSAIHAGPTVAHGSNTEAIASVNTEATEATPKQLLKQNPISPKQNQALYPRSESLSPLRERETLREGAPAQRESHAPPPEGAGRDSRTGTSEGTRGETPAVPESPAPAPAGPSPKDPVPSDRWRLWLPEQMPSPTPPPESQWADAMAWRLMRLTRFAENARPRDYAHLAEQQRVTEELYRDVCDELAPRVTEYQGLALLYHLDDRIGEAETDTSTKLMRWLRAETRPQEALSDAVH